MGGLAGGALMVPVGLILRAQGKDVNVYGELTARVLLGSTSPPALLAVHVAVSLALAAPAALLAARKPAASWAIGFSWPVAAWLLLNVWLLPLLFDRPSAWSLGWPALWPGLLVHVAYGAGLACVLGWLADARVGDVPPRGSQGHP